MTKKKVNIAQRKYLVIFITFLIGFIVVFFPDIIPVPRTYYPNGDIKSLDEKAKKTVYYVVTKNNEEYLCWEDNCGWTRGTTVETLVDAKSLWGNIPAFVSKSLAVDEITSRTPIAAFIPDKDDSFPIKAFLIGKNKVVLLIKGKDSLIDAKPRFYVYAWDKNTNERTLIVTETEPLYPISLQPEEKYVLIVKIDTNKPNAKYSIFQIDAKKHSSFVSLASFSWAENDQYIASESWGSGEKLPSITCPVYTDVMNCLNNTRSYAYFDALERTKNTVSYPWIFLSYPGQKGWESGNSSYDPGLISLWKNRVIGAQVHDIRKTDVSKELIQCYRRITSTKQQSTNGKQYILDEYAFKSSEACTEPKYNKAQTIFVLQDKEFRFSLVVAVKFDSQEGPDYKLTKEEKADLKNATSEIRQMLKEEVYLY